MKQCLKEVLWTWLGIALFTADILVRFLPIWVLLGVLFWLIEK